MRAPRASRRSGAARTASKNAGQARSLLPLVIFGLAAATAVAFGFLAHTAAEAGLLVQRYGYYALAGTTLWWLLALYRRSRSLTTGAIGDSKRERIQVVGFVAGVSVVSLFIFPYSYKILYDELVLQATAWNLHYFREVGTVVRGYEIEGIFASLNIYLDKRPYFFSFLVSLVHDLTGYRELNGFLVNTLLLPLVLVLFYAVARKLAAHRAAFAALVCFGASTLLAQNANGMGMELINLAMLLLVMRAAVDYLAKPDDDRLSVLILSCVLLAQTRYESALYVIPAAIVVLEGWRRVGRVILPAAAMAAPLLLIPCALHNTYLSGTPALWELRADLDSRFGVEHVANNLTHAGTYFFALFGNILNSWWLSVTGWLALGWATCVVLVRVREWPRAPSGGVVAVLFAVAVLANLGLLMFYFWGQLDDPIVARLVLPFHVILALAVAWATQRLAGSPVGERLPPILVGGALLVTAAFGMPAAAHHSTINLLATELAWEWRVVETWPPKERLVITNKSALAWLMRRVPVIAIHQGRSRSDAVRFHLEQGTFQEVLVTQVLRSSGPDGVFVVDPEDLLPSIYVLEPVVERHIGSRIARISRVVRIDPAPVKPAAEVAGEEGARRDDAAAALASATVERAR